MQTITVGLLGFGTVGCATRDVFACNHDNIKRRAGRDIQIITAAVRDLHKYQVAHSSINFTTDPMAVVNDPNIQVVVELMGGTSVAKECVLATLKQSKHVVTANKALIAEFGNEIFAYAQEHGVIVAFEAAIAGGIPIIKAMREGLAANIDIITLHEGNTSLNSCVHLTKQWNIDLRLYVKYEGLNPTASFKDRGMTVVVSQAVHEGSCTILCASTGNTSAAVSAYAARVGMRSVILIPKGSIAMGKLAQAMMHGATIVQIAGRPVKHLEAVATAIRLGNSQSWDKAVNAQQTSGGWFKACTDEEILAVQRLLATTEGLFVEPASAASIAGLQQDIPAGTIPAGSTVTGHGLKDPDVAMQQCQQAPVQTEPELAAVQQVREKLL